MEIEVPEPMLLDADETSITIAFRPPTQQPPPQSIDALFDSGDLYLQYRLPHVDWSKGTQILVERKERKEENANSPIKIEVLLADLTPGTPYIVRFCHKAKNSGGKSYGKEVVFDTAPIGCTPRRKKRSCTLS